jgi:HEAT repeat protein
MLETRDTGLLPEAEMHARAAGDSPYDMACVTDRFPVAHILAAADLVGRGPSCLQQATAALSDSDAAVRFWAATALTAMGADAASALPEVRRLLADDSASVRLAAAETVCRLGDSESALPVLVKALNNDSPAVRLQAGIALAALGSQARPVLPSVRRALEEESRQGDYSMYIRWILERVVRQTQ